jgi:hypothetical protein
MNEQDNAISAYNSHAVAEEALQKLSAASLDIKKISIIGKGYHTEEKVVGYYTMGDRVKSWGAIGAFGGGLWGLLLGAGFFLIPGRWTCSGRGSIPGGSAGRPGIGGSRRRSLSSRGSTRQHGHSEGRGCQIRGRPQSREIFARCAWHSGGCRTSTIHFSQRHRRSVFKRIRWPPPEVAAARDRLQLEVQPPEFFQKTVRVVACL